MSQNRDQNLISHGAGGHVKIGAAPQRERGPDLIPVPIVPDRSGPTFPTFNMALVWPTGFGLIIVVTCVADVTTFHNVASSATPKYLALLRAFDQRVIGVTELSGAAIAFARRNAPSQIGPARRGKRSHEPRHDKSSHGYCSR
jgi:hypothetical protein